MAEVNLNDVIDQVSKERGISREVFIEAIEEAILKAAKKLLGEDRRLEATYNREKGQVEVFQYMTVVKEVVNRMQELDIEEARKIDPGVEDGDELGFQIFYLEQDKKKAEEEDRKYGDRLQLRAARQQFGRIAAQTAKQVIIQKTQEAERIMIYNEYKDRKGEIITGIARRFEKGNVIIDIGKTEAILLLKEQSPRESYRAGDRVQAYLKDVLKDAKGHQLILSRTDPRFVAKLFAKEVPEIAEGIVKIMNVAREPGERTKISVYSTDSDVDPVGACVGLKGARVQAVVQELRGEKIDIVPYSSDMARYVCSAIAPAEVQRVLIDENKRQIEVIVADDQLSLAIGKKGQNVKLATKLLDWRIEIHSESKVKEMKEELRKLTEIPGVDDSLVEYLFKVGFHSADNIVNADITDLTNIPGISEESAVAIQNFAREIVKKRSKSRDEKEAEAASEATDMY